MGCSPPGSVSMGFSRQECWSGLPCPFPEDLPDPVIESTSLTSPALASGFFTTSITREATKGRGCSYTRLRPGFTICQDTIPRGSTACSSARLYPALKKALVFSSHFSKRQPTPGVLYSRLPSPTGLSSITLPLCAQPWAQHSQAWFCIWTPQQSQEGGIIIPFHR